jgi:transposase
MAARKLNPHTQRSHIQSRKRFAAWLKRSPDTAKPDEVRLFQLYLVESGMSICNRNRIMTGVRFLFRVALRRHEVWHIKEPERRPKKCVPIALPPPFVLEGAMNGETLKAYVEQFLAPTLKKGDIVFMDNASVHMVEGVEEAIQARGAILFYLPAYSPDLNPIEQLFAKLKSMLRTIAAYSLKQAAYTVDSLCAAIASSLTKISRSECAAYLANSGQWSILWGNALTT